MAGEDKGRNLGRGGRRLLWAALAVHVVSVPASFAAGDRLGMGLVATTVAWVAFAGMGAISILVLLLPLLDLADRGIHLLRSPSRPVEGRRRFFAETAALVVTGGLSAVGYQRARALAEVKEVEVPIEGLHPDLDGLTLVQITDLHVGPLVQRDAVAAICDKARVFCQASLEEYMACGFGVCVGCAVEVLPEDGEVRSPYLQYSRVCVDGPVFDARRVNWGA